MDFAPFADEFHERVSTIVYCTMTTVSPEGAPRSRIVHPVWEIVNDRPVGWVVGYKTPVKLRHLENNPRVSVMYWSPDDNTVAIDATARWQDDETTREYVWNFLAQTPSPYGYDPNILGVADWNDPVFTPLRFDPTRIQMLSGEQFRRGNYDYRVWKSGDEVSS